MAQVLGCHVQRSLSCHDLNLVDLVSIIVQLTKQHQLDSLLQEVCIYNLAHSQLKLIEFSVGTYAVPGSLIYCMSWSRSWCWHSPQPSLTIVFVGLVLVPVNK